MMDKDEIEIYIHIPFCVKKCLYCDFLSAPATKEIQNKYMQALFEEISTRADEYRDLSVSSVFIGGGTPSLVDVDKIEYLMNLLHEKYIIRENAEVTMEVNPGTVAGKSVMERYFRAGINRLSIGLQSADDTELKKLGRIHDYGQFLATYDAAVCAGFTNINIDIMSDIPGQSFESYRRTLYEVTHLNPKPAHISAYSLIVEEGTPFYDMQESGALDIPDEECDRKMYEETKAFLEKEGYHRYEISNYAVEGCECRHNVGYWTGKNYIGFGIGAASLYRGVRFNNGRELAKYMSSPCNCRENITKLTQNERMEEFMFLGLRMMCGVSFRNFEVSFGKRLDDVYGDVMKKNIADGLLYIYDAGSTGDGKEDKRLAFTDRGIDISNYVLSQFIF